MSVKDDIRKLRLMKQLTVLHEQRISLLRKSRSLNARYNPAVLRAQREIEESLKLNSVNVRSIEVALIYG